MINIIQNGEVYEISFKYDKNLVDIIRKLPQRNYIPNSHKWVVPKDGLEIFMQSIKGTIYESNINFIKNYDTVESAEDININANRIPDVDISNVRLYVENGSNLYKHQLDFMKYALYRQYIDKNMSGFLLCDDPGLGKTLECMNLALYNRRNYGYKHCLIICGMNSAKYNWINDIDKHTNGQFKPYLLGSRYKKNGDIDSNITSKAKVWDIKNLTVYQTDEPAPYFLVTNIESLRYKLCNKYEMADSIINQVKAGNINMIIIDEIHKNMSPTSLQGKLLLKIKERCKGICQFIPVTGTPITNKPVDVFLPLKLVDAIDCKSYYNWCKDFCVSGGFGVYDIIRYKNIYTLKSILENNMLRRRKTDVIDLPPIVFNDTYFELSKIQKKLYERTESELKEKREEICDTLNPLNQLLILRQICNSPELVDTTIRLDNKYKSVNAKYAVLLDILLEIKERNEKVIIFSNWVKPLNTLYYFISKFYPNSVLQYNGEMSLNDREFNKKLFLNDDSKTILLGTIGAAGVSHTFTSAQNVIFYDEPYTYADKQQAWERVHRIGTNSIINVYTLLALNTIDERVHKLVYDKKCISEFMVDSIKLEDSKIIDYLLGV